MRSDSHLKAQRAEMERRAHAESIERLARERDDAKAMDGSWYCIRANCAQARRAQRGLAERGVVAYLPIETRWIKSARRKLRGSRPLLGTYLFVKLDAETPAFHAVLASDGVAEILGTDAKPQAIPERFVIALWSAEIEGVFDKTRPRKKEGPKFTEGDAVRIAAGVLEGHEAIVLKVLGPANVRILYTLFGRDGEATINPADLAPIAA